MQVINIHAAKTQLSSLIEQVEAGEEITIARAGKPVAKLVPIDQKDRTPRVLGIMKGKLRISEDFDAPLPDEVQALFDGR